MTLYQLRPYQQAAVDSTINWINYMPDKNGIVWAATAAGKSVLIAEVTRRLPQKKILILAHRKELLEQNASKLQEEHSLYSAGLGEKDLSERIVVAGIQSIARAKDLPKFDLVLADECHRISNNPEDESQYWSLIKNLGNPQVIGFTATPYRLGGGFLNWGEIIYQMKYPELLGLGFAAPLTNKATGTPDLSKVQVKLGEYVESQLEAAMIDPVLLEAAITALQTYGDDRNSILIFCVSKKHCELLSAAIIESAAGAGGCTYITGETTDSDRALAIGNFRAGNLRILINCMVLIEGFDAPNVDMILCLRPTMSKALWEQILGRGVRLNEGKDNCLLVDMAGNLVEHGSLAAPYHEPKKGEAEKGEKGKVCPECEEFNEGVGITECGNCGYQFPEPKKREVSHFTTVDTTSDTIYQPNKRYDVSGVRYRKHVKSGTGAESLRVDYICYGAPYGSFSEWLSVKHANEWVRDKAWKFFKERGYTIEDKDIQEYDFPTLIKIAEGLRVPIAITVDTSDKYARITDYEFEQLEDEESEEENRIIYEDIEDTIIW